MTGAISSHTFILYNSLSSGNWEAQINSKMKKHLHNSLRTLFLSLAVLLSLPMLAQKLNLKEVRLTDDVRELSLKEGLGDMAVPAPARHVVNNQAMKAPSRTENTNPYEAMAGKWTMTTAAGSKWNVTVIAAAENDPDYNKVLYVTGMMGYDWTMLTMNYGYNFDKGKLEVSIKAGKLFADGVNFGGIGVCDIYLYNLVDGKLTTTDFAANVSIDDSTITLDFGEATFTGGLFQNGAFTGYVWFKETGVKMTRVLPDDETGIDELKGENGKRKTAVYDLSGRRVQKAQKGVFIQNGKIVVK